jgi:vitamin B12 transporter
MQQRRLVVFLNAAVFTLALAASARAQTGELSGTVRTAEGTPLPQIRLLVHGPDGLRRVTTGSEGRYRLAPLAAGDYTLEADVSGFQVGPRAAVSVGAGPARLDLTLAPAPVREQVTVSAARGEAAASTVGVTTTVIDRERIADRESALLLPLLSEVPGLATSRAGGPGHQGSTFVRGGESRYARVLVDGVPVNEPGGAYDFGFAVPLEVERIEVVRGAASSLYGTDALAGVIEIVTQKARAGSSPLLRLEAEGGSFDWRRGQAGTAGTAGRWDWNAGLQRLTTDNEGPNARFEDTAAAATLGVALGDATSLRLNGRGRDGRAGTPGQTAFGRPDLEELLERSDLTLGATLRHSAGRLLHELRIGYARSNQVTFDPADSGDFTARFGGASAPFSISDFVDPLGFQNDVDRLSASYRAETQLGTRHLLTSGVDVERESGALGERAEDLLRPERTNVGVYVQDRMLVGERLNLTLGARLEHNGSFGTHAVPRVAVSWRLRGGADATLLHASAGTGIKEPDFFQSFGTSFFALGNPDLKPERSRTFDLGLEQRLLDSRLRLGLTAFHNEYLDQVAFTTIDFDTFQGTYVNLAKTRARGLEAEVEAAPTALLRLRAQYTFTDGEILVSPSSFDPIYAVGESLLRRPRHRGGVTLQVGDRRAALGATVLAVGRRADSDFVGLGLTGNEGYTRVDARARLRVRGGLEAFLVAENLFDREYQEALGYPALGRAVRGGLRWRAGR